MSRSGDTGSEGSARKPGRQPGCLDHRAIRARAGPAPGQAPDVDQPRCCCKPEQLKTLHQSCSCIFNCKDVGLALSATRTCRSAMCGCPPASCSPGTACLRRVDDESMKSFQHTPTVRCLRNSHTRSVQSVSRVRFCTQGRCRADPTATAPHVQGPRGDVIALWGPPCGLASYLPAVLERAGKVPGPLRTCSQTYGADGTNGAGH